MADACSFEESVPSGDVAQAFAGISATLRTFEEDLIRLQDTLAPALQYAGVTGLPAELQVLDRVTQGIAAIVLLTARLHKCASGSTPWVLADIADSVRPVDVRNQILLAVQSMEGGDVLLF